jgi:arylsulfatase A-like enzyme
MVRHIPGGKKNGFDQYGRAFKEFHYLESDPALFPSRNWLPLEHTTYPEALGELGYYNAFVGKWHLGHEEFHPTQHGFDMQIGASNYGHPKSYYPPYFREDSIFRDDNNRYLTDRLTDEAVGFISSFDKDSPFMLTFSYYSVHSPHIGRKDLVEHFKAKGLEGKFAEYAAMIKATDESVGRVMQAITEKGIAENTILIFLSDQGGFFENAPLRGGKMKETLYEGGARVPFFFYWPGVTSAGTTAEVVQSTDLFPTLVELSGGDVASYKDLDGTSLLPVIKENKQLDPRTIFGYRAYEDLYVSARKGDWKLLAYRSGETQLYNIKDDMSETTDLAGNNKDLVNGLVEEIVKWEKEMKVEQYSGLQ